MSSIFNEKGYFFNEMLCRECQKNNKANWNS